MDIQELISRLAVALGIGLLIGLERGWRRRQVSPGGRAAGIRTFAISGLLGGVIAALAQPLLSQASGGAASAAGSIVLGFGFAAYAAVITVFTRDENRAAGAFSATTAIAGMLTFALGAYALFGDLRIAVGAAIAAAGVLAFREELHGWVEKITWPELQSGLVLLAMTFLGLPIMPNNPIGPFGGVNPREVWIIAIVLAYLEADQAAEVLSCLPANMRSDIMVRIATLDGVQPSALSELDDIMEKTFAGKGTTRTSALGGAKAAAEIINNLEPSQEGVIMEQITQTDEALGSRIQDLIFVFDNLLEIDDRSMQELLRQVASDKLLLAMKGADDAMKEKIFKNMSQRAAEMLKDDLESKGPVKISEVEGAQKEILQTARKLAEAGTIQLAGKGDEYV